MTRALLCALLVSSAAAAADPEAELESGTNPVEVKGAGQQHYRIGAGKSLGLKVTGPASFQFSVRAEGAPAKAITAVVELDGKLASSTSIEGPAEAGLKSNRDLTVTKATEIAVAVPAGKHAVGLRWASDAPVDALVAIAGLRLTKAAGAMMALPGLDLTPAAQPKAAPLPLPLPGAEAKPPALADAPKKDNGKRASKAAPPPLPLPSAPDQKQASEMLPLPGIDQAPAAAKPAEQKPAAPPAAKPAVAAAPAPAPAAGATGTRTLTAQKQPPQAAAAAPFAPAPQLTDQGVTLRGPELWSVTAMVGGDRSSEDYTAATSSTRVGLLATRAFSNAWLVEAEFNWRNSTQQYAIQQPSGAGQLSLLDENRFDFGASGGYDFGPRLLSDGRLELMPLLGVKYVGIRNRAFPSDLFGPQIGAKAGYSLSSALIVQAELGYTYNLAVTNSRSALGAPVGDFAIRAGLTLPMSGRYALSLNYQGDVLAFNYVYRVAHGAAVGLGYSF